MQKNNLFFVLIILILVLGVVGISIVFGQNKRPENNQTPTNLNNNIKSAMTPTSIKPTNSSAQITPAESDYKVTLETDAGNIVLLLSKETPITTGNFVGLAEKGFYNNVIFHRVINGFMIQGGDPTGTGMGGPGYKFNDEPFTGEYTRGTIAMANAGPNTNGSQFFIMHQDNALPKNYVIFGKVVEGMDVVDKIATASVDFSASGEKSKPIKPVKILKSMVEKV